jgi:KUP system potassium uptake protein
MPTIKIADDVHPNLDLRRARSTEAKSSGVNELDESDTKRRIRRSSTADSHDGIYNIRSRTSVPPFDRRRQVTFQSEDDDPGLRREGDYKQKQVPITS